LKSLVAEVVRRCGTDPYNPLKSLAEVCGRKTPYIYYVYISPVVPPARKAGRELPKRPKAAGATARPKGTGGVVDGQVGRCPAMRASR
jgi:hypothetical protein